LKKLITIFFFIFSSGARCGIEEACDSLDTIGQIVGSFKNVPFYTIQTTPTGPVPGVILASIQDDGTILKFCEYYKTIKQAEGYDQIYLAGKLGNELFDEKYTHHLDFFDSTYNMGNTIFNLEEGGGLRPGALTKRSNQKAMNSYLGDIQTWKAETFEDDSVLFGSRAEREREMREQTNRADRISKLGEMVNCNRPKTTTNFDEIYEEQVEKNDEIIDESEDAIAEIFEILNNIGYKISSQKSHKKYQKDLIRVINSGVTMTFTESTKKVPVTNVVVDASGNNQDKTTSTTIKYQKWNKVGPNEKVYEYFLSSYLKDWKSYVTTNVLQSHKGLATNPRAKFESEFYDIYYECSSSKMSKELDSDDPDYDRKVDANTEQCRKIESAKFNQAGDIMTILIAKLKEEQERNKKAKAVIWSIESEHLGVHRQIKSKGIKYTDFKKEEIRCSSTLNYTQMMRLGLELDKAKVEATASNSELNVKKTALLENQMNAEAAEREQIARQRRIQKEIEGARKQNRRGVSKIIGVK
jgi:hypothetical protein